MRSLLLIFVLIANGAQASGLKIEISGEGANGEITIDLLEEAAPLHAERIMTLAREGAYNGVVFHRVIDGFMAQTGDCLLYTSPSPRDRNVSRMPSAA